MSNDDQTGITWQEITKAILLGLSGISFGISDAAKELLFDRIEARQDARWKTEQNLLP